MENEPSDISHIMTQALRQTGARQVKVFPEGQAPQGNELLSVWMRKPIATAMDPNDIRIYTRVIGDNGGNDFAKFLDTTDLVKDTDYVRHGGGMRGGSIYFDFVSPSAVDKLQTVLSTLPPKQRGIV